MTITERIPGTFIFEVTTPLEAFDEPEALVLDHLLDHLHALILLVSIGGIPDEHTQACLNAHARYQDYLDGSVESTDKLITMLRVEVGILLATLLKMPRTPHDRKPGFYRATRDLIPYLGHADYPGP